MPTFTTTRDLELQFSCNGPAWPTIKVPKGAAVIRMPRPDGMGHCYAIEKPTLYGADKHTAEHYYLWVPVDAVYQHHP